MSIEAERSNHRADIQALRGLAVLIVVLFHAGLGFSGGFVGVDVFFVVSGFVITGLLSRELEATGRLAFANFYTRRSRRLLPSLALVTVVTLLASIFLLSPTGSQQDSAKTAAAATVFSANAYLYRFGVPYFNPTDENPFIHMWSLAVEEQTYLLLPLLLLALWKAGRRLHRPAGVTTAGIAVISGVTLVVSLSLSYGSTRLHVPLPVKFAFYSPVTRLWEFGVGALLALTAHHLKPSDRFARVAGFGGLSAVIAAAVGLDGTTVFPGKWALLPVLGTAAMIGAGSASTAWKALASPRPLVWLGDLSYGWYLWHWPAIVLASYTWPDVRAVRSVAAGLSLMLAVFSRRFVEEPFRRRSSLVGKRALLLAAVCVAAPLALAVGVVAGANRGWGVQSLQLLAQAQSRSRSEDAGCDSILRTTGCEFPGAGAGRVVLVGDSHAAALSDAVLGATHDLGADFAVWTRPGCLFVDRLPGQPQNECRKWADNVIAWLKEYPPDVLVIHSASSFYRLNGSVTDYIEGLRAAIDEVVPLGTRVVLIEDVPNFPKSDLKSATLLWPDPQPSTRSLNDVLADTADLRSAQVELASQSTITFVPTASILCHDATCTQFRNGWIYRDADHLTKLGASILRPTIEAALRTALK